MVAAGSPSIAVLPLVNLSRDPDQEYFADGLAEELLDLLAKVPGLHVAARTSAFSFKGKNEDARSIASKLNVATLLEGSVQKSGDRVRITAQLVSAANGYHLWSETYDRNVSDVLCRAGRDRHLLRAGGFPLQLDLVAGSDLEIVRRMVLVVVGDGLRPELRHCQTGLHRELQLDAGRAGPRFFRSLGDADELEAVIAGAKSVERHRALGRTPRISDGLAVAQKPNQISRLHDPVGLDDVALRDREPRPSGLLAALAQPGPAGIEDRGGRLGSVILAAGGRKVETDRDGQGRPRLEAAVARDDPWPRRSARARPRTSLPRCAGFTVSLSSTPVSTDHGQPPTNLKV